MRYENRLQRLEQSAPFVPEPIRIIRYLVDPKDGMVGAIDKQTGTRFHRVAQETEDAFKARADLAMETVR